MSGKIKLSNAFSLLSEGFHVIKIDSVIYKEEFGRLSLTMLTEKGEKHTENFRLIKSDGTPNGGAYAALARIAKAALCDDGLDEFEPQELEGHFFACNVVHESVPSTKDPTKTFTNVKFEDVTTSEGWDAPAPAPALAPAKKGYDLSALLGRK